MKTLREILQEVMDKPYDFEKINSPVMTNLAPSSQKNLHKYSFESPHDSYKVNIYHNLLKPKHAEVEFTSTGGHLGKSKAEGASAHKIFSTVHHILRHHLSKHKDQTHITFGSTNGHESEGSRTKLYRHLARKMTGVTGSEPNKHKEHDIYGDGSETGFTIDKKDVK